MSRMFAELDSQPTRLGVISLRRRKEMRLGGVEVYEVKLGEEFLMSSLFHVSETELARLGLAAIEGNDPLDILVGGLGLGYTAASALKDSRLASLLVVEALSPVIEWHRKQLVPLDPPLAEDDRCRFVGGDFFALAQSTTGFDPDTPGRRFHAILLDIDHAPDHLLNEGHRPFYEPAGLAKLARHLYPGGVFALWSNDPPDSSFMAKLETAFEQCRAEIVRFANPYQGGEATATIYVGKKRDN